jgi:hypothetical protein
VVVRWPLLEGHATSSSDMRRRQINHASTRYEQSTVQIEASTFTGFSTFSAMRVLSHCSPNFDPLSSADISFPEPLHMRHNLAVGVVCLITTDSDVTAA